MDELKKFLIAFLVKTLNIDEKSAVASLYNEDGTTLKPEALASLLKLDGERIASIKKAVTDEEKLTFDNGYKKATEEVRKKDEKVLKEKYKQIATSDKPLIELVDEIVATASKIENLPVDVIKKHPAYISLETDLTGKLSTAQNDLKTKLEEKDKEFAAKETFANISKRVLVELEKLNPVLPKNPDAAQRQKDMFLDNFKEYTFQLQKDDAGNEQLLIIGKDGKRVQNEHGHLKTLPLMVKEAAEKMYDLSAAPARSSGGAGNEKKPGDPGYDPKQKDKKVWGLQKPKDESDYMKQIIAIDEEKGLSVQEKASKQAELVQVYKSTPVTE